MIQSKQEASSSDEDRGHNAFGEDRQFPIGAANKRRGDEEQIDRHVGKNEGRDKRNSAFPLEIENADVAAP